MSNLIERQHLDPEEGDALVIPKSFRHRDMANALLTLATPTWLTSSWGTSTVTPQRTMLAGDACLQFGVAELLGMQCWSCPCIVLLLGQHMPRDHRKLAGDGDRGDVLTALGAHP